MTAREVIRVIEADGWYRVKSKGGHQQFKHPIKRSRVTVPVHGNKDLSPATVNSILKQAGLK